MSTKERPSDEVVEHTVNRRFRRLLWLALAIVVGFTTAGYVWAALDERRDMWQSVSSGFVAGLGLVSFIALWLMILPKVGWRFGLPSYTSNDEREQRNAGWAHVFAYDAVSFGCMGYGAINGNMAVFSIALFGQFVLFGTMVVLNRRR